MRCPSASVAGFGGATYSGTVMRLVLVVGVGFGFGEGEGEGDGLGDGLGDGFTEVVEVEVFGVTEVVGVVGTADVVEVFDVVGVGIGWTLGMVGIGSGGRSGKDGWLGAEVVGVVEVTEVVEVVGVGFGRSGVVEVVVVTSGGNGEGEGDGVGVGFWRRLLRRMRISASRGWGTTPGLLE